MSSRTNSESRWVKADKEQHGGEMWLHLMSPIVAEWLNEETIDA